MKHALWAVNGVLGLGIVTFTVTCLVFPARVDRLADIDPAAALPSPPRRPAEQPNEEILKTLRNPLRHRDEEPMIRRPDPVLFLLGALPTLGGVGGIAFIRTPENVSLVVPIGEEVQGWRLVELWKDRALFANGEGRTVGIEITSNPDDRSPFRR